MCILWFVGKKYNTFQTNNNLKEVSDAEEIGEAVKKKRQKPRD